MSEYSISQVRADLEQSEEWQKAQRGEMYTAFVPELIAVRAKCIAACDKFNNLTERTRRNTVQCWREITLNPLPLPSPPVPYNPTTDDALFQTDPWILAPTHIDYGINVHVGPGSFINFNSTFVDTCPIRIGSRVLVGPNCAFYAGGHPVDPGVRAGLEGPENGRGIEVGDDVWIGGNVVVLMGVRIGRGATVGAGSVVTRDVPPFHVVAGNPARIIRKIESALEKENPEPAPVLSDRLPDELPDSVAASQASKKGES